MEVLGIEPVLLGLCLGLLDTDQELLLLGKQALQVFFFLALHLVKFLFIQLSLTEFLLELFQGPLGIKSFLLHAADLGLGQIDLLPER